MNVKGKITIVTGASSGIGLATAKLLSGHGVKVALVARSKQKLEEIAKNLPDSLVIETEVAENKAHDWMGKR